MDNKATIEENGRVRVYRIDRTNIGERSFKKTELKPHQNKYYCIPPKQNAEFVACMEDVLDVYAQPIPFGRFTAAQRYIGNVTNKKEIDIVDLFL